MPEQPNDKASSGSGPYIDAERLRLAKMLGVAQDDSTMDAIGSLDENEPDRPAEPDNQVLTPTSQPQGEEPTQSVKAEGTTAPPKKRRKWVFLGAGAAVLALGGWILVEQLNRAETGPAGPPTAGTVTAKADPESVRVAVESRRLVLTGNLKEGCAMYAVPQDCFNGWDRNERAFAAPPTARTSAAVPAEGAHPAGTVTVVAYRKATAPDVEQRWAVLVRDSDHKVLGTESLGRSEAGMSLTQVGRQIREAG